MNDQEARESILAGDAPAGLHLSSLDLPGSEVEHLPEGLRVDFGIDLSNCTGLRSLPERLRAGSLSVRGCTSLSALPEGMELSFLDISDCPQLTSWPTTGKLAAGRLRAARCTGLRELPPWIGQIAQLDISDCEQIDVLPSTLQVSSWMDVAGTKLSFKPSWMERTALRWRGVPVDERIAFRPEEITGQEILAERNAELRRVMLERVGFERFLLEVDAEVLDTDEDPGGERRLLRVPMTDDEDLVCVSVFCPSTGRQYVIRVPPDMKTCHQAIAWTAGFDDPDEYEPILET